MKKQSLILATAIASALTSGVAVADLTANGAASNNYIWRGITQTNDVAAVSGGIDWADDNGIYAGTWVSNIAGGQEVDFYGGMGLELAEDMTLDVGGILYYYTTSPQINFAEVYANLGIQNITAGVAMTVSAGSANKNAAFDSGDIYASVSADFDAISVYAGSYMFDAAAATDYIHYGVSMSKDDVTFSIDKNDNNNSLTGGGAGSGDNIRVGISWTKEWEL